MAHYFDYVSKTQVPMGGLPREPTPPPPEDEARKKRFALPGFTLPLNWTPDTDKVLTDDRQIVYGARSLMSQNQPGRIELLPNALSMDGGPSGSFKPLREFKMMQFIDSVTDKENWHVKVHDESITAKWKAEAMEQGDFTQKMADWCIEELKWKAKGLERAGFVTAYDGDVIKSDSAVSDDLKERLKAAVKPLEGFPEKYKDYHPGSDGKVLDLVHPSLFPLVYGKSRILKDTLIGLTDALGSCGKGEVITVPPEEEGNVRTRHATSWWRSSHPPYSRKFQWLPCEVEFVGQFVAQGDTAADILSRPRCKISSYINNLHPDRHEDLYGLIEELISITIPHGQQK